MSDNLLLGVAVTKAIALTAELKNVVRDVEGLMYERTADGEMGLRDYVPTADTNTSPPDHCDAFAWSVRHQAIELQEYLEQLHLGRLQRAHLAMVCPCCAATATIEDVLGGIAGWKLVSDTHSENLVGDHIMPVQEWQCGNCAPYAHSELNRRS